MNSVKRMAIIIVVVAFIVVISASFISNDILNRSIIIGLGLDLDEDNKLVLTAEVVSPGNGSEQVGTFSKTVTVKGETISQAVQQISQKTGKEASLGQCALLILGESLYKSVDFSQVLEFFINSYNFKENSAICCVKGSAKDTLNYGEALSQSVSLALIGMLQQQAKSIAIPTNSLLEYTRSQQELLRTGYVNYVEFIKSDNFDSQNPKKEQGYFTFNKIAIFRENKFIDVLTPELTRGFAILDDKVNGDVFIVEHDKQKITFIIGEKSVDTKLVKEGVKMQVKLHGRLARTDDFGSEGILTVQTEKDLPKEILQKVQQQATQFAQDFLNYQLQNNVDLVDIHEVYRKKHGTTQFVNNLAMEDINIDFSLKVQQK